MTFPAADGGFSEVPGLPEVPSAAPIAIDLPDTGSIRAARGRAAQRAQWLGMSGYLAAGVVIGLLLIVAMSFGRGADAAQRAAAARTITDNVVRLDARAIGASCWREAEGAGPARLTVSLEVGLDGKVRYAAASGESAALRGCVEAHVKGWEFLPQAQPQTMALPVEIARP